MDLKKLKSFAFDSDGCLFPNTVWEGVRIKVGGKIVDVRPKIRSYYDGQGISLMRALGIRICIITNEKDSRALAIRVLVEKWNGLPSCVSGAWQKIELFEGCGGHRKLKTLKTWLAQKGGTLEQCGAMGDDLVDVSMLKAVAFSAAPITAEKAVRDICAFVSERNGGEGAVRDLANFLVAQFGRDPFELPFE